MELYRLLFNLHGTYQARDLPVVVTDEGSADEPAVIATQIARDSHHLTIAKREQLRLYARILRDQVIVRHVHEHFPVVPARAGMPVHVDPALGLIDVEDGEDLVIGHQAPAEGLRACPTFDAEDRGDAYHGDGLATRSIAQVCNAIGPMRNSVS